MLAPYYAPSTVGPGVAYCARRDGRRVRNATDRLRSAEQTKSECHALNPKARAPTLVAERGVLTETPAILAIVAQSYHEARSRRSISFRSDCRADRPGAGGAVSGLVFITAAGGALQVQGSLAEDQGNFTIDGGATLEADEGKDGHEQGRHAANSVSAGQPFQRARIKRPAPQWFCDCRQIYPSGNPALRIPSARRSRQARWARESLYLTVRNQPTVNLGSIASPA